MLKGRVAWKKIRDAALVEAGHRCIVCRQRGKILFCHEKWRFSDQRTTVKLSGFEMVCERCNSVLHAGRSILAGYVDDVVGHLCRINKCDEIVAAKILSKAFDKWNLRSQKKRWKIEVTQALLKRYPELVALPKYQSSRQARQA
ncbi:hypothetical protein [Edaphobacter modestus]|uniref:hypothetical protein n=1 Tax=Edaphobacter modestus TaxID=388466 RepID=UPI00102BC6B5|nr:hypothetical protein [Edaphobacter modestus]